MASWRYGNLNMIEPLGCSQWKWRFCCRWILSNTIPMATCSRCRIRDSCKASQDWSNWLPFRQENPRTTAGAEPNVLRPMPANRLKQFLSAVCRPAADRNDQLTEMISSESKALRLVCQLALCAAKHFQQVKAWMWYVGVVVYLGKFLGILLHKLMEFDGFLVGSRGGLSIRMKHAISTHIFGSLTIGHAWTLSHAHCLVQRFTDRFLRCWRMLLSMPSTFNILVSRCSICWFCTAPVSVVSISKRSGSSSSTSHTVVSVTGRGMVLVLGLMQLQLLEGGSTAVQYQPGG